MQLYETMMTRHTTMVVGPTGGGKSVVIKTLAEAQTKYAKAHGIELLHIYFYNVRFLIQFKTAFCFVQVGCAYQIIHHQSKGQKRHRTVWCIRSDYKGLDRRTPIQHL